MQDQLFQTAILQALVDCAYDALLIMDEQRRVLALNESAKLLFSPHDSVGATLMGLTGAPELELIVEDALANREETLEDQISINRRAYRVRTKVIQQDGVHYIGLVLQDVSELVRLNRARRDMVANISHELRTPIANIRLIIDSLFQEDQKPKRKRSISSLQAIARETDSLLWILQEMLDLSMIESGQAIMRMVEVPLRPLVEEVIERMQDQSDEKEQEVVNKTPEDLQVLCDRDLVRRVLINLVHNAVKWAPPDGKITVSAESRDDEVTVSVVDSGPGVPDEERERIFERFYQVDASRSGHQGTGLGLAICKHIIEAHGGQIWAEGNSYEKGGRFRFTLPAAE